MKRSVTLIVALLFMLTGLAMSRAVLAASPSNDNIANATTLPLGSFTDQLSVAEATTEPGDPVYCVFPSNTVWYTFTAGSEAYFLTADAIGSDYEPILQFFRASPDGLQPQTCANATGTTVFVGPGETWYIQVTGTPPGGTTTTGGTTTGGTTTGGTTTTTGETSTGTTTTGETTSTGGTTGTSTGTTGTSTTGTSGGTVTSTTTATAGNLVFNSTIVLYVPIDITVTVGQGSVDKTGYLVTLVGTVSCSRTVPLSIYVPSLTQTFAGRLVAVGSGGSETFDCGPTAQPWTVNIAGAPPVLFGPGNATAMIQTSACDEQGCGFVEITVRVRLKRG